MIEFLTYNKDENRFYVDDTEGVWFDVDKIDDVVKDNIKIEILDLESKGE